jgi:8-oxo-dGTP pyrophosphatase MutT (NUDIX family)/transcriptional regulator with XRE-family HTH domain
VEQVEAWRARIANIVGSQVRRYRTRPGHKMSAQELSDAIARLGGQLPRGVIAKLESGRRNVVTVDELLIIAAALGVEPLRLLVPLDDGDVEMLPGFEVNPWKATRDFAGLDSEEMALFAEYTAEEQNLRSLLRASIRGGIALDVRERKMIPRTLTALVQVRQKMADRGLAEPELAADVQKMLSTPYILNGGPTERVSIAESEKHQIAAPSDGQPIVAAIVTSDRGVLVGRRNDGKPPWTFIAGEQDAVKDELPQDTAIREVKEETGLRIQAGEVIGERVHPQTGRTMIYLAATPTHGTDVFVGDEAELAEVQWVSLAEADELLPGMYGPVREYLAATIGPGSGS